MSDHCKTISIGVPIYNVEKYIERCAVSLFEQTYPYIEYVFVDDCSSDYSIEILEEVISRYPTRKHKVKLLRNSYNWGTATTRNVILDNCTGEFILWVDSDDFIKVDTVSCLISTQQHCNCDILGFGVLKHNNKDSFPYMPYLFFTPKEMFLSIIERKTHNGLWGRLVRRSIFTDNNLRFKDGQDVGEDFRIVMLLSYYALSVYSIKDTFYYYECGNSTSLMKTFSAKKAMMVWHNIDSTKKFFVGKGSFYEEAFKQKEAKTIINQIISCFSIADYECITLYIYLKKRARKIELKHLQGIEFSKKMIFFIPSYSITKYLCRVVVKSRKMKKKLCNLLRTLCIDKILRNTFLHNVR